MRAGVSWRDRWFPARAKERERERPEVCRHQQQQQQEEFGPCRVVVERS